MSGRLDGTVALVTGASSGIGAATAQALAAEGARVVVAARRRDRLDALVGQIHEDGGRADAFDVDITAPGHAEALVERIVDDAGRLDTVVNNAGVMLLGPALDASAEEWERMVDLNVTALLRVTHAALPHLVAAADDGPRGVADLVTVSSVAGRRAAANSAVYNLTKFGVTAFSEALRQELAESHVRVGSVEPGAVDTELAHHIRPGVREDTQAWLDSIETLKAEDIADAIHYMVTRARHVAINELLVRPTVQK
ncbi:SDR family NAD(P)-dependent oxidoreductase [Streptomyces tsukubensis]|uniref:Oxidoreductase n=1 Tax=Streptomyces tsukubensis TaxID=83656 RepID=A0A1V4A011_9ACTN|nr:oxidoreductase [Streptomyces tsukubensis]QFR97723.1 SDR family NAD(P)-dependent oxidoreductase [Streptomyces tsukubensis]